MYRNFLKFPRILSNKYLKIDMEKLIKWMSFNRKIISLGLLKCPDDPGTCNNFNSHSI